MQKPLCATLGRALRASGEWRVAIVSVQTRDLDSFCGIHCLFVTAFKAGKNARLVRLQSVPDMCAPHHPEDWRLLLEHKMYEPALYATVIQDCKAL